MSESAPPKPEKAPSCEGCGHCCREQGLPPGYTVPVLMGHIPKELREEIETHLAAERSTGITRNQRRLPCIWLDLETGYCLHYEHRPPLCRAVKIASDACNQWRTRYGLQPFIIDYPPPAIYAPEPEAEPFPQPPAE